MEQTMTAPSRHGGRMPEWFEYDQGSRRVWANRDIAALDTPIAIVILARCPETARRLAGWLSDWADWRERSSR